MRAAFARPGFARLYAGLATSAFGDSIMLLVLSMWVKTLTDSNAMAGLTFMFMAIPGLFAPLMGPFIDRVRRRPLLVWGNLLSALAVLPLVLVRDEGDVWLIWLVAGLYGVSFVVLPAAVNGLLKELLPDDLLVEANAAVQTTKEAYRLVGPLVGAALFAWSGGWVVAVVDAASFVVAAVTISSLRVHEELPQRTQEPLGREMAAGIRHLVSDRILRHTLIGFGLALFVLGFTEASIYALLDAFDKPPTYAGVFVAAMGVGAVGVGLFASRIVRWLGEVGAVAAGLLVIGVNIGAIAAAPTMTVVLLCSVAFGAAVPVAMVAFLTMLQRRTPQALMGRASTAVEVVLAVPNIASLGLGAILVAFLDYRAIFAIIAVVTTLAAAHIAWWLRAELGSPSRLEPTPVP